MESLLKARCQLEGPAPSGPSQMCGARPARRRALQEGVANSSGGRGYGRAAAYAILVVLLSTASTFAVDPNDPFDQQLSGQFSQDPSISAQDEESDKKKSAEELINDATILFTDERPLDARTKLLRALEKEPNNYRAHLYLAGYYLGDVGHFRLALKYINRARQLFESQHGQPPYSDPELKNDHARILYLLSETRLNLDNYQGALDALDEYSALYFASWYPASRAWVLMKLGRLDEAIKVARIGMLAGAEPGRTLNILGILLSMKDQRQDSIAVFNQAIIHELSMGRSGQPATPLNNSGEVYREIFREDRAEASWLKAVGMPDGCEHVLPSLNLTILYLEQLRFGEAKRAMDNFETCVAQFPLRNGEEHRALVHMARGRIDMHTGHIDSAIAHMEGALARRQWFGKIGTSQNDLLSASLISLGQALRIKNNHLAFVTELTVLQRIKNIKQRIENHIRAAWLWRRARQVVAEDLNNFEDIYVRRTDSMIEYHTLGDFLAGFPSKYLEKRISDEQAKDQRTSALPYYLAWQAQDVLGSFSKSRAFGLLSDVLSQARSDADAGLRLQVLGLKLRLLKEGSPEYRAAAEEVYRMAPAELRNQGLRLPVRVSGEGQSTLERSAFFHDPQATATVTINTSAKGQRLEFRSGKLLLSAEGESIEQAVDKFADTVFSERLG